MSIVKEVMDKRVVLSFGNGEIANGFPSVRAQFWDASNGYPLQITGSLPAAPELPALYRQWQLLYLALYHRLGIHSRIKVKATGVTNVSEMEFDRFCQHLSNQMNTWLRADSFRLIEQQLRTWLNASDEIRIIIETNDPYLRQFPWHLWHFLADYPYAEVALSVLNYQRVAKSTSSQPGKKARILAILGDSQDIDVSRDRAYLEQLSTQAEIQFLVEPDREELHHQLWQGWDMLFFAGHSATQETGFLRINPLETLTLEQLKWALNRAIANGLKLAIFNSCDGLGLAQSLADLHIPQVIVMREPVPDVVAQEFLKHFLAAFVSGRSLYTSVREARERLQGMEGLYPCASWLPVICQNPAEVPTNWGEWMGEEGRGQKAKGGRDERGEGGGEVEEEREVERRKEVRKFKTQNSKFKILSVMLISLMVTALVMGVRHLGWLQRWELQSYDVLMQNRPEEGPDRRLLIVSITEDDFQIPQQKDRKGSLSDLALAQLLEKLEIYQPRAIGLDIFRDFPVAPQQTALKQRLRQSDRLFAICHIGSSKGEERGIGQPPDVPQQRQGFSNVIPDADGVVRRQLLSMDVPATSICQAPIAFSLQVALQYLKTEGITPEITQGNWQLDNVVFRRLQAPAGGYQAADTWGNQVLLNYRSYHSPLEIAEIVTLKDVLTNQVQPEQVHDRVVLIGLVTRTSGDQFSTPYSISQSSFQEMPGVMVHAQMVSQILSAVLDQRSLIGTWSFWNELVWVWGWSIVGGLLAWRLRSRQWPVLLIGGVAVVVLHGLCFWLLIQGRWVPLIPPALALVATGVSVRLCDRP